MTFTTETVSFLWIGDLGVAVDTIESFEPFNPPSALIHPPSIKITLRSGREHYVVFGNRDARNEAIARLRKVLTNT